MSSIGSVRLWLPSSHLAIAPNNEQFPGLRAFTTSEQAAQAILEVEANYQEATQSALEFSSGIFDATHVIAQLLPRPRHPSAA
jgi:hypothetical protein